MKEKLIAFGKKETVFVAAVVAAVVSAFWVKPSSEYLNYPDYRVLSLLFCLMILVAGLQEQGVFLLLGHRLTQKAKDSRSLMLLLVLLCFFCSMLITNDVALITFVPFALTLLEMAGQKDKIILTVVLQTIAANLGSMLTPVGNPQNLYLYTLTGMSIFRFLTLMLPLSLLSLLLLLVIIGMQKPCGIQELQPCGIQEQQEDGRQPVGEQQTQAKQTQAKCQGSGRKTLIFTVLFGICLLTVVRLLPYQCALLLVVVGVLCVDRRLFARVDYCLLGTFLGFFIFVGNMQRIPGIKELLEDALSGRELLLSILVSQVISNVPAAMLLSGFTEHYEALLQGVNIGGLGTLVASLASVISFKNYGTLKEAQKGKYLLVFTAFNLLFLVFLTTAGMLCCRYLI